MNAEVLSNNESEFLIDDASLSEVAAYIHSHKEHMRMMKRHDINYSNKDDKVQYLSNMLNILTDIQYKQSLEKSPVRTEPVNPAADPQIRYFRWRLLIRIIFGYMLFARNSSTTRCTLFVIGSLLYYLLEVGLIGMWFKAYIQHRNQNRPEQPHAQPRAANDTPVANDINLQQQPPAHQQDLVDYMYQLTQSGIKIPVAPGIFMDIISLVFGFFSSLFPSWRPMPVVEPVPESPVAEQPPAPAGAANGQDAPQ